MTGVNIKVFNEVRKQMLEDGVPNTDNQMVQVIKNVTGQDLTKYLIVKDGLPKITDLKALEDSYIKYREDNRIPRWENHRYFEGTFLYLGRFSTQDSSYMYKNIHDMADVISNVINDPLYKHITMLPFVINEVKKIDYEFVRDKNIHDHINVQLLRMTELEKIDEVGNDSYGIDHIEFQHLDVIKENYRHQPYELYFNSKTYLAAVKKHVDNAKLAGWTVIERKMHVKNDGRWITKKIPVGAIQPKDHGGEVRQVVIFWNNHHYFLMPKLIIDIIAEVYELSDEEWGCENPTKDSIMALTLLRSSRKAVKGVINNIKDQEINLNNRQKELDKHYNTISILNRTINDETRSLEVLQCTMNAVAVQNVTDMVTIPDLLDRMKQVKSHEMIANNDKIAVEFVTYPFGLRADKPTKYEAGKTVQQEGQYILHIPSLLFKIDLTSDKFERAVIMTDTTGKGNPHPHITGQGYPCWGNASGPLAEAWGCRRWEGFIRLLLAWITQCNSRGHAIQISNTLRNHGQLEKAGWVIPVEEKETNAKKNETIIELVDSTPEVTAAPTLTQQITVTF